MRRTVLVLTAAMFIASCATEDPTLVPLDARGQLIRLSVDLVGTHPSEVDLLAIEEDPLLYDQYVDRFLGDERFLERIRELFNLNWQTRNGQETADEPLRLISHVVEHDLPFTEIVTATYTMADPIVADRWSIDIPDPDGGWQAGWYRDGREHAGVLSMSTVWSTYPSAGGNANRHRANAVSRLLLCDDYLDRPIAFSRNVVDQVATDPEETIRNTESCQSCHATLDPLASHFFGFPTFMNNEDEDIAGDAYRPENEQAWQDWSGRAPGWFGTPTSNLIELGAQIALDPRFIDCATETVFEGFTQRSVVDADWTELQGHRQEFVDSGLQLKALVRSIVRSEEYRAASTTDPVFAQRLATVRTVSPAQLAGIVEGVTGFRWQFGRADGLTSPTFGLKELAGGVTGYQADPSSRAPSVSLSLVQERLAQAAAWEVVAHDFDPERDGDAILLAYVTLEDRPEASLEAFEGQIRQLHLQILGRPLEAEAVEVAMLIELWQQIYSLDASPTAAWAGVVAAILRDPAVLLY
jgi:hypothetical protein